jgi:hypothetical protein
MGQIYDSGYHVPFVLGGALFWLGFLLMNFVKVPKTKGQCPFHFFSKAPAKCPVFKDHGCPYKDKENVVQELMAVNKCPAFTVWPIGFLF